MLLSYIEIFIISLVILMIILFIISIIVIICNYKKCPSDKILVKYGRVGVDKDGKAYSSRCYHGGATFVYPFIQSYQFLSLKPLSFTLENRKIGFNLRITVGISTEPEIMQNAAERLLGLNDNEIIELAKDISLGQLRLIVRQYSLDEVDEKCDVFLEDVAKNVETEIRKIGLRLININLIDIDYSNKIN